MGRRRLVSILDKMIALDLFKTMLSMLSVIVVIIVSQKFVRILDKAVDGQISDETLLTILEFKTLVVATGLLPAAAFMAVLMVLGRMYRDHEMSAIASAGGGLLAIYRAVFLLMIPVSVVSIALSLVAAPWAEARIAQITHHDEESADLRGIAAKKFSEYSQGDLVFYVENIDENKKLHKIFVQHRQNGKLAIITADEGRLQDLADGRYIVMEKGERVQGFPGELNYVIESFNEYAVRIDERTTALNLNLQAMATVALWQSIMPRDVAELQRRISVPLSLLCFVFLAVPLAQIAPRGGAYGNLLVAFLIYFIYGNLAKVSQSWVIKNLVPAWFGGYWLYGAMLVLGIVLLIRLYGWQWFLLKAKGKVI
jgi:lipopolysaccharide export system permease protein